MEYNKITYYFDKKGNRYRFFYEAEYFESGNNGHHVCGGNYFDVYSVNNHFVAIKNGMNPVFCCDSFTELCVWVKANTGCTPERLNDK